MFPLADALQYGKESAGIFKIYSVSSDVLNDTGKLGILAHKLKDTPAGAKILSQLSTDTGKLEIIFEKVMKDGSAREIGFMTEGRLAYVIDKTKDNKTYLTTFDGKGGAVKYTLNEKGETVAQSAVSSQELSSLLNELPVVAGWDMSLVTSSMVAMEEARMMKNEYIQALSKAGFEVKTDKWGVSFKDKNDKEWILLKDIKIKDNKEIIIGEKDGKEIQLAFNDDGKLVRLVEGKEPATVWQKIGKILLSPFKAIAYGFVAAANWVKSVFSQFSLKLFGIEIKQKPSEKPLPPVQKKSPFIPVPGFNMHYLKVTHVIDNTLITASGIRLSVTDERINQPGVVYEFTNPATGLRYLFKGYDAGNNIVSELLPNQKGFMEVAGQKIDMVVDAERRITYAGKLEVIIKESMCMLDIKNLVLQPDGSMLITGMADVGKEGMRVKIPEGVGKESAGAEDRVLDAYGIEPSKGVIQKQGDWYIVSEGIFALQVTTVKTEEGVDEFTDAVALFKDGSIITARGDAALYGLVLKDGHTYQKFGLGYGFIDQDAVVSLGRELIQSLPLEDRLSQDDAVIFESMQPEAVKKLAIEAVSFDSFKGTQRNNLLIIQKQLASGVYDDIFAGLVYGEMARKDAVNILNAIAEGRESINEMQDVLKNILIQTDTSRDTASQNLAQAVRQDIIYLVNAGKELTAADRSITGFWHNKEILTVDAYGTAQAINVEGGNLIQAVELTGGKISIIDRYQDIFSGKKDIWLTAHETIEYYESIKAEIKQSIDSVMGKIRSFILPDSVKTKPMPGAPESPSLLQKYMNMFRPQTLFNPVKAAVTTVSMVTGKDIDISITGTVKRIVSPYKDTPQILYAKLHDVNMQIDAVRSGGRTYVDLMGLEGTAEHAAYYKEAVKTMTNFTIDATLAIGSLGASYAVSFMRYGAVAKNTLFGIRTINTAQTLKYLGTMASAGAVDVVIGKLTNPAMTMTEGIERFARGSLRWGLYTSGLGLASKIPLPFKTLWLNNMMRQGVWITGSGSRFMNHALYGGFQYGLIAGGLSAGMQVGFNFKESMKLLRENPMEFIRMQAIGMSKAFQTGMYMSPLYYIVQPPMAVYAGLGEEGSILRQAGGYLARTELFASRHSLMHFGLTIALSQGVEESLRVMHAPEWLSTAAGMAVFAILPRSRPMDIKGNSVIKSITIAKDKVVIEPKKWQSDANGKKYIEIDVTVRLKNGRVKTDKVKLYQDALTGKDPQAVEGGIFGRRVIKNLLNNLETTDAHAHNLHKQMFDVCELELKKVSVENGKLKQNIENKNLEIGIRAKEIKKLEAYDERGLLSRRERETIQKHRRTQSEDRRFVERDQRRISENRRAQAEGEGVLREIAAELAKSDAGQAHIYQKRLLDYQSFKEGIRGRGAGEAPVLETAGSRDLAEKQISRVLHEMVENSRQIDGSIRHLRTAPGADVQSVFQGQSVRGASGEGVVGDFTGAEGRLAGFAQNIRRTYTAGENKGVGFFKDVRKLSQELRFTREIYTKETLNVLRRESISIASYGDALLKQELRLVHDEFRRSEPTARNINQEIRYTLETLDPILRHGESYLRGLIQKSPNLPAGPTGSQGTGLRVPGKNITLKTRAFSGWESRIKGKEIFNGTVQELLKGDSVFWDNAFIKQYDKAELIGLIKQSSVMNGEARVIIAQKGEIARVYGAREQGNYFIYQTRGGKADIQSKLAISESFGNEMKRISSFAIKEKQPVLMIITRAKEQPGAHGTPLTGGDRQIIIPTSDVKTKLIEKYPIISGDDSISFRIFEQLARNKKSIEITAEQPDWGSNEFQRLIKTELAKDQVIKIQLKGNVYEGLRDGRARYCRENQLKAFKSGSISAGEKLKTDKRILKTEKVQLNKEYKNLTREDKNISAQKNLKQAQREAVQKKLIASEKGESRELIQPIKEIIAEDAGRFGERKSVKAVQRDIKDNAQEYQGKRSFRERSGQDDQTIRPDGRTDRPDTGRVEGIEGELQNFRTKSRQTIRERETRVGERETRVGESAKYRAEISTLDGEISELGQKLAGNEQRIRSNRERLCTVKEGIRDIGTRQRYLNEQIDLINDGIKHNKAGQITIEVKPEAITAENFLQSIPREIPPSARQISKTPWFFVLTAAILSRGTQDLAKV